MAHAHRPLKHNPKVGTAGAGVTLRPFLPTVDRGAVPSAVAVERGQDAHPVEIGDAVERGGLWAGERGAHEGGSGRGSGAGGAAVRWRVTVRAAVKIRSAMSLTVAAGRARSSSPAQLAACGNTMPETSRPGPGAHDERDRAGFDLADPAAARGAGGRRRVGGRAVQQHMGDLVGQGAEGAPRLGCTRMRRSAQLVAARSPAAVAAPGAELARQGVLALRARTSRYRGLPSSRRPRAVKGTVVTVNPDAVRSLRTAGSGQVR